MQQKSTGCHKGKTSKDVSHPEPTRNLPKSMGHVGENVHQTSHVHRPFQPNLPLDLVPKEAARQGDPWRYCGKGKAALSVTVIWVMDVAFCPQFWMVSFGWQLSHSESLVYNGVSKNRGGKPPKTDGEKFMENPMNKWDDWGGFPIFLETPDLSHGKPWCSPPNMIREFILNYEYLIQLVTNFSCLS